MNLGNLSSCLLLRAYIKLLVKCFLLLFLLSATLVVVLELLVCTPVEPVSCDKIEWREGVMVME